MLLALAAFPLDAEAQRRGPYRGPVVRQVVFVGGYGYYPRYRLYDPWFQWGRYPPYGGYYGYPAIDRVTSSVRLEVTPRDAEVFVDGFSAGLVDDFDGVFQRLRVEPGPHEITVYLNGYRTIRRSLYLGPGTDQRIRETMDRLGAGETSEAPPAPSAAPEVTDPDPARQPRGQQLPPRPERQLEVARASFGTVAIRVQPADADIFVDGEKWAATSAEDRLSIRLTEGRHRIEVKKDGFVSYAEGVLIRRNATLTLNVSLSKGH